MQVDNLYLSTDIYRVLDEMFFELRLQKSELFSRGYKESGEYLLVQCPYHKFGLERKPSAQFRKSDGLFYCHACKETHSLDSVVNHCLKVNGRQWLIEHFEASASEDRKPTFNIGKTTTKKEAPKYVDKAILERFRFTHPYMFQRKLNIETIRKYDIGYDKDNDCITFPNKDPDGNILFIATRNVQNKYFHYPSGVEKPVYGLYEIYREMRHGVEINEVYVCESMLDALAICSWGKYAVAFNGTGSKSQYEIIRKSNIRCFILAFDNDDAGRKARAKFKDNVKNKFIFEVDYNSYGDCKDINDMTKEQFLNANIIRI